MLSTRAATPEDLRYVLDIDAKCFDDPWPNERWQKTEVSVAVATVFETPAGVAVFELTNDGEAKFVRIDKIAVKPHARRQGLSRMLMDDVLKCASFTNSAYVQITVPESVCVPNTALDITPWLAKLGFRGVGITPRFRVFCGDFEDGFIFRREIQ